MGYYAAALFGIKHDDQDQELVDISIVFLCQPVTTNKAYKQAKAERDRRYPKGPASAYFRNDVHVQRIMEECLAKCDTEDLTGRRIYFVAYCRANRPGKTPFCFSTFERAVNKEAAEEQILDYLKSQGGLQTLHVQAAEIVKSELETL